MWLAKLGKGMLSSVEQVFVGRDEGWAPLKTPVWEAVGNPRITNDILCSTYSKIYRASDISRKKKQNFAGFSGANSRKNQPISRDFRGKKVEIRRKISRFPGFSREKSQNSRKNRPISRDFSAKKSNFEGFSGAKSWKNRPISREISGKNFAKKQSVKNSRFRWIFDQFCVDMTSVV